MRTVDLIGDVAAVPSLVRLHPAARGGRGALTAWLMPDLALTAAMASLVYLFALFGGASALFRDSDTGWHIRNGERILASMILPAADPYSFSKAGEPWLAWEWAADVATGAVHQVMGMRGVALLYGLAIAAVVWMWFRVNRAAGGNFLLAAAFAAPMMSTINLHWLARPHLFSWLLLLGSVWVCERMPGELSWWYRVGAFAGTALWANVHGSFFFAPVIAMVYAAGSVLRHAIWADETPGPTRSFLLVAAWATAGSFLNPYGINLHLHIWNYLTNSALLDRIGEFQSFNFHSEGAAQITLGLTLCFTGGLAALSARRPERFLLTLILTFSALRMARSLPVAVLLALPLANGSITTALSLARGMRKPLRRALDFALSYGDRLGTLDRQFHGLALVPVIVLLTLAGIGRAAGFPEDQFPVGAAGTVDKLPTEARIFAPDKFGGYLIYRFGGQRKVFFDGRSDFYGAEFLKSYSRMVQARPGWQEDFKRWNFSHALLPADSSLTAALLASGWQETYGDKTAVVLARQPDTRQPDKGAGR